MPTAIQQTPNQNTPKPEPLLKEGFPLGFLAGIILVSTLWAFDIYIYRYRLV